MKPIPVHRNHGATRVHSAKKKQPTHLLKLRLLAERGLSKLTILVFGTLFAAVLYTGYSVLPFYYCYYEIQNQMEQAIRVASTYTDAELRDKLVYHIKKLELPVNPEELRIEREAGFMKISLPYEEVFYVTWEGKEYDLHTFKFHAYAEGSF